MKARLWIPGAIAGLLLLLGLVTGFAEEPRFETSDTNGGWSVDGYYVHNNMWNSSKYDPCTSTLRAWSPGKWIVTTRMNNSAGDGAVKTYPNVHRDYRRARIDSFEVLRSTFVSRGPEQGIYNFAYDIWINGIASRGCTEVMIWTDNFKQVPGGRFVEEVTFGGRAFQIYRDARSGYIALVARENFSAGTVDLLEIVRWTIRKGWVPEGSTIDQICYGVEVVSTEDKEVKFRVDGFTIDEQRKPASSESNAEL